MDALSALVAVGLDVDGRGVGGLVEGTGVTGTGDVLLCFPDFDRDGTGVGLTVGGFVGSFVSRDRFVGSIRKNRILKQHHLRKLETGEVLG